MSPTAIKRYRWNQLVLGLTILLYWFVCMVGAGIIARSGGGVSGETGWITLAMLAVVTTCMATAIEGRNLWFRIGVVPAAWIVHSVLIAFAALLVVGPLLQMTGYGYFIDRVATFVASLPIVLFALRQSRLFVCTREDESADRYEAGLKFYGSACGLGFVAMVALQIPLLGGVSSNVLKALESVRSQEVSAANSSLSDAAKRFVLEHKASGERSNLSPTEAKEFDALLAGDSGLQRVPEGPPTAAGADDTALAPRGIRITEYNLAPITQTGSSLQAKITGKLYNLGNETYRNVAIGVSVDGHSGSAGGGFIKAYGVQPKNYAVFDGTVLIDLEQAADTPLLRFATPIFDEPAVR